MTPDRILAIIGVILGLPGVLTLALTANQTLAITAGVLAVLLLGAAYYVRHILNAPPYRVKDAKVTLSFPEDHRRAILRKEYRIVPNFGHLRQMEHKNIAADGQIENICWDDRPVPPSNILFRLGEYEIKIDWPIPPRRWQEFSGKLSYDCINSFDAPTEMIVYCVDFPTRCATIVVEFPHDRPCNTCEARQTRGASEVPVQTPELSQDRRRLELKLRRPSYGAQYVIYWTW